MQSVMRVVVQSQVDECLVRCVATPGGQETNSGINTRTSVCQSLCLSVCLSVGFSFFSPCPVAWTTYPRVCGSWPEGVGFVLRPGFLSVIHRLADGLGSS